MTLNKKLQNLAALTAASLALATPAKGLTISNPTNGEVGGQINAAANYTNDDTGVSYDSLRSDSQWFDMWQQAFGVSDAYTSEELANSGLIGYNIDSIGDVSNGWFTTQNADGTVSYDNIGGPADDFSTNKTMTGNFFAAPQLNDMDGDGLANYALKNFADLSASEINDPLTIVGQVGANNGGNSITAYEGTGSGSAIGNQYALVPTANHPVPESASGALLLGVFAWAAALARRRSRPRE